jgi:hypothetical protein
MIKDKSLTIYVASIYSGNGLESMVSTNAEKVFNSIKIDVNTFYNNHPKCSNKQLLRTFTTLGLDGEINIFSEDGDSFIDLFIDGNWISFDLCDTGDGKNFRYAIRTDYVTRD